MLFLFVFPFCLFRIFFSPLLLLSCVWPISMFGTSSPAEYRITNNKFYAVEKNTHTQTHTRTTNVICVWILVLQLDLVLKSEEGGDISDFITNGEWFLLGKFSLKSFPYSTLASIFNNTYINFVGCWSFFLYIEFKIIGYIAEAWWCWVQFKMVWRIKSAHTSLSSDENTKCIHFLNIPRLRLFSML